MKPVTINFQSLSNKITLGINIDALPRSDQRALLCALMRNSGYSDALYGSKISFTKLDKAWAVVNKWVEAETNNCGVAPQGK